MEILNSNVKGSGDPLIILHGFLGMGDNWKSLSNKFSEHYQVHLVDQRNHGRSFHSSDFNYELMAEDLLRYIEYHNLKKVNLIGHSMGGKVAMLFAVTYPERMNKLIVADIGPKFYPRHHDTILEGLLAIDFSEQKTRGEVEEVLKKYIPEWGVRQFLLKNVYWKTKEELAFRFNLEGLIENMDEIGTPLPSLSVFEGETLFLKGENSGYISDGDATLVKSHFPKAIIKTVKNAGHWLHAENPTDFYNYVVDFIAK
ncbi:alpha/beta fold hydrolase [Aureibaculum marinum]|uniref:Alpha/beta fold hydrolase n=1 Tax=Aureibaculum marinum TaxID=2487930 RepID=A0A3N4P5U7_9FLAO|nr:alpha/beta fold hydrolase [Aureibaculum marinum]RPD99079.1 alpha/beta fold hydrolase [Aureibaculum marinum]